MPNGLVTWLAVMIAGAEGGPVAVGSALPLLDVGSAWVRPSSLSSWPAGRLFGRGGCFFFTDPLEPDAGGAGLLGCGVFAAGLERSRGVVGAADAAADDGGGNVGGASNAALKGGFTAVPTLLLPPPSPLLLLLPTTPPDSSAQEAPAGAPLPPAAAAA